MLRNQSMDLWLTNLLWYLVVRLVPERELNRKMGVTQGAGYGTRR